MRIFDFSHEAMVGTARARLEGFPWRTGLNLGFAIGAGCMLQSAMIPALWLAALLAIMGCDAWLARRYLAMPQEEDSRRRRLELATSCFLSFLTFAAMSVGVALYGYGPGRMLAVLMAGSALVNVMSQLYKAPSLMVISAAPLALCVLTVAFLPPPAHVLPWINGALGITFGAVGFLAYIARAAMRTDEMFTQLKLANRAVEARRIEAEIGSRAKTEFLAKMTHDLRTPLNAVIGYAEILREDMEAGGGAAPADAARIHDAARRLVGIVDDAVTLSKIETANMRFDAGVIDAVLSNDAPTRRRA